MNESFAAWFSGFFDGEGSITCLAIRDKKGHHKIVFRMSITQRTDEMRLLEEIQKELGGIVYPRTGKRTCAWALDGAKRISSNIIPIFDSYSLKTKKAEEWKFVKPLILKRAAMIEEGNLYTTKPIPGDLWDEVVKVQRILSEGRETWQHLRKESIH